MQRPKPMQYILFINTISKFKIEGGIFCVRLTTSFLQRLSHHGFLTLFHKTFFSQRFSSKLLPQRLSNNVFLTMSFPQRLLFSQRLSNNAFPTTSSHNDFLTTSFLKRLYHNAVLMTSISQRLSHNVFLTMSFLQRHYHKDFLTASLPQRLSYNVFLITNF